MAQSPCISQRTKNILYGLLVFILSALFIGFLAAFITERNKNYEHDSNQLPATTTTTTTVSPTLVPTIPPFKEQDLRLNGFVKPSHYSLEIRSDPNDNFFNGTIKIELETIEDQVDEIILHCKYLLLFQYSIDNGPQIETVQIDVRKELCKFKLEKPLAKGQQCSLQITYSGQFMPGQITGFYRSPYRTEKNELRYMTATKFEPTYARMAFPCFDEPSYKATFDISVIHPKEMTALSNQIELRTEPFTEDGWLRTTFDRTVPMSTYLVAFVVSDFAYTETKTRIGTRVRVYSRPDQVEKTKYALDAAAEVLSYYENLTGISYVYKKMDLIGLPEFVSGAMENWGLVTYKETYVLFSENESSMEDMLKIGGVIAHELSHMWWGNLVTLDWWNNLWVQEGFASLIEYYGKEHLNKSWSIWNRFQLDDLHSAMNSDSLITTHVLSPKKDKVLTPDQITAMFDTISYSKGASILYMIENIIGKQMFQNVAKQMLKENQYSTIDTEKMLSYFYPQITIVTGIDGQLFMKKWIYENGFPVVTIKRIMVPNSQHFKPRSLQIELKQENYNSIKSNDKRRSIDDPFNIYVKIVNSNHPKQPQTLLFNQKSQTFDLGYVLEKSDWLKLNPGGSHYYITNYDLDDWKLLTEELKRNPNTFPVTDRANLLFDAYRLADVSMIPYETLLNLMEYLKLEDNYIPWTVAASAIKPLQSKLTVNGETSIKYRNFIRNLVSSVYDKNILDQPPAETYEKMMLQNNLISLSCQFGYEPCIKHCTELFRNWMDSGKKIDPSIKSLVYKYGLQSSTKEDDWMRIWDLYTSEKDAIEKSKLMSALSGTQNSNLISLLISYSQDQKKINNENFFSVQQSIASNSDIGRSLVWDYIKNHWPDLVQRFGLNDRRLGNYVRSVVSGFQTESRLNEVQEFFKSFPDAGAGEAARTDALQTIKNNIKWNEDNLREISKSLDEKDHNSRPWLNWRLNEYVRPQHYDVNLTIDVDKEEFGGTVQILLDVQQPIEYLILHAKELNIIDSAMYVVDQSDRVQVSVDNQSNNTRPFLYEPNQFYVIPMKQIIQSGQNYMAELSFNGKLSEELSGLYLSRYNDSETGQNKKLATTQFEAGYARKAFPCFDEPQFKATFTISIRHLDNYTAISNMPVEFVKKEDSPETSSSVGLQRTIFERSVPMSTYLVAFVVSDFVSKSSPSQKNFSVYTYNPNINLKKVDYALDIGPKVLEFYARNYFDIDYPLPKMDMISIPDFSMGAMENWGLITYRDVYLLYDDTETNSRAKSHVCQVIAHELAHMWFGNLVTMKWWDDLWLNEGFAQFMQYKATDHVEPTWQYQDHFVINEFSRVYEADSLPSTHAILTQVTDDNSIQAAFDAVTYAKGATIIRMLESMIGEEQFRMAVQNYMKKHSYSNTETKDLWTEFSAVIGTNQNTNLDIERFMDPWIRKEGFPVITITNINDKTIRWLKFSQERFLKDFSESPNTTYIWSIPITYRLIEKENSAHIKHPVRHINMKTKNMIIDQIETDSQIVKYNIDQKGLYVVNYPNEQWTEWIRLLNNKNSSAWKELSALDRHNLLMDAFYLARSGRLSYDLCLKLAEYLRYERSYVVWQTAADVLRFIRVFLIEQDGGVAYNYWVREKLLNEVYEELGWMSNENDDLNQRLLRQLILDLACQHGHEQCLQKAYQQFDLFMENYQDEANVKKMDPDILSVVLYHTMATNSNKERIEFLKNRYLDAKTINEKMRYLQSLSAVEDKESIQELMEQSLNSDYIRSQDFFTFLAYMANNPVGRWIAWDFYKENYEEIQNRYGLADSNVGRAIYRFAFYFTSEQRLQDVLKLYEKYPIAGASALYRQQALDLINANIRWSNKFYKQCIQYLTDECPKKLCPWNQYRLSKAIQPLKYDLNMQVNTTTFIFNGTVEILVNIIDKYDLNYIILHSVSTLNVSEPNVIMENDQQPNKRQTTEELSTGKGFHYPPLEFYVIELKPNLNLKDKLRIKLKFNGLLSESQVGFYRGWYELADHQKVNLASTQLQSIHARKVFPCFDEPTFKAPISLSIIHDNKMTTTLSNMDILSTNSVDQTPEWNITKYKETPPMVSYLLAILVSDFQCSSSKIANSKQEPISIRICSSKAHSSHKHNYSLEVTPKILKYFEHYTSIPYSLSKLDQIALPQFQPGAMENWGLVFYRERKLLWSADEEDSQVQKGICTIIAHELSHQWFGNLVTMEFWGDLWLNEAMASYMSYGAVNFAHPEWQVWNTFASDEIYPGMHSDMDGKSHPLVRNVEKPKDMDYISNIVYYKGASILNMLAQVMGEENFQKSVQKYLKDHSYSVTVTKNLFDSLELNWPHKDQIKLEDFMQSWTHQPGFPYLNITFDHETQRFKYVQQRMLRNGNPTKNDTIYNIPFSYYSLEKGQKTLKKSPITFLKEKSGLLPADYSKSIFKVNPNFSGYYFVNYAPEQWSELIDRLVNNQDSLLSVNDRSELIISAYFLSKAKLISNFTVWNLFNYLVNEKHYSPWNLHSKFVASLAWKMERTEYRPSYIRFERRLSSFHYSGIEMWNDTVGTTLDRLFRKTIINLACGTGNSLCMEDAYKQFYRWKNDHIPLAPNLFFSTLSFGLRSSKSTEDDYDYVWKRYLDENNNSFNKTNYLDALAYIHDSNMLRKYLDLALNESLVSNQHYIHFFKQIISRYEHDQMIWAYFKENFQMLSRKLTTRQIDDLFINFGDNVINEQRKTEMWNFSQEHPNSISLDGQESAFARVQYNLGFMTENKDKLGQWFSQNACGDKQPQPCPWANVRLDQTTIQPLTYDLTIQVNLTTNIYNGTVKIEVETMKPFRYIVMHAAQMLKVDIVSVEHETKTKNSTNIHRDKIENVSMFRYIPNDFIVLEFDKQRPKGKYILEFKFRANLFEAGLSGLYLSNYTDGGRKYSLASTQFEFFAARKVFPCFDEPAFKSKFSVAIIHDRSMKTTLSNMKIVEEKSTGPWIETRFAESVKMVSYLVAMIISEFQCKTITQNNIVYGVCASHLQQHKMDYALEKAPKCLEHLEKKLGQKYPMEKVDLIAIPDFDYGAMENWGLVTFRETALLFHESDTTSERKMRMMNTIAHEIAHFWFGNLVTCEWWDYFTLNEAFATYMQYTSLEASEPEWKVFDLFLMDEYESALLADASKDNHPLIRNVTKTNQIETFDSSIIYSKGATILRMVESLMGTDNFYNALKAYLEENKFKSVRPEHLLKQFDAFFQSPDPSSNIENMSSFLEPWLFSHGVPYLNVTETETSDTYQIVQDRFVLQKPKNETKPIWNIPISYYSGSEVVHKFFNQKEMNLQISSPLVKLNTNHSGYYLTNYSPKIWKQLIEELRKNKSDIPLTISDRAGLLMDSFYLAKANLLSYNIPLNLAQYLINEDHITPWTIAIRAFNQLKVYIEQSLQTKNYELFQKHLRNLVNPIYQDLNWKDDGSVPKRRLMSSIIDFACSIELPDCLQQSNKRFDDWMRAKQNKNEGKIPPPNLLGTVLKYGLKDEHWLFVWEQYSNETSATLRQLLMNALVRTKDEKLLRMLLTQALEAKGPIRSQDSNLILVSVANTGQRESGDILWKFFRDNFEKMIDQKHSPLRRSQVTNLLQRICEKYFFTEDKKRELKEFFARYPGDDGGLTVNERLTILTTVDTNLKWMKERMIEIERFLLCRSVDCPFTEFRLNPDIQPTNYDLNIKVNLDEDRFEGSVKINVKLANQIKPIYLIVHAAKTLNISKSEVKDTKTQTPLKIEDQFRYEKFEFWVLKMKKPIDSEEIQMEFEFNSALSTDNVGFYLSKYFETKDEKGTQKKVERKLASTQFQDTYARRAFPCFDEPSFKSVFSLKVQHSSKYRVLSNTMKLKPKSIELDSRADENQYITTEFEKTPKMVTYLLAFIISDFQCKNTLLGTIQIQVCSSPPELVNINYTLDMAPKLINSYQNKFNYPYQGFSLGKMDLIAIPDFYYGAMENWGLLTFRETALLYNPLFSSAANKMSVISVVAHEIAHMWFGNLVTCNWWTDLWLNEAFASYLEWFSVSENEPDWNYKQLFYITDYIAGMDADSSITAHALARPPINSPEEIPYITAIIYQKGASILRMFESVLEEKDFYGKCQKYLKKYEFNTVTAKDFLNEMATGTDIEGLKNPLDFFESWTLKPGFPVLDLKRLKTSKADVVQYEFTQRRFLATGIDDDDNSTWIIPLSYYYNVFDSPMNEIIYLTEQTGTIKLNKNSPHDKPVKFNVDSLGFYIVNYERKEWEQWAKIFENWTPDDIQKIKLTSQDYSHLMYDSFRLANVDLVSFDIVLDLLKIMKNNEMFSVWSTGSTIMSKLWPYFRNGAISIEIDNIDSMMKTTFQSFAQDLVVKLYQKYNLQISKESEAMENIQDQRLRSTICSFACAYGYDVCLAEAQFEYKKWQHNYNDGWISPNVITTVLRYGIQQSNDDDDWHYLWQRYLDEDSTVIKLNYLQALAQTPNEKLLKLLLDRAMNQTLVRRQDYHSLYSFMLRTTTGFKVGWQYFKENYRQIKSNRLSASYMGRVVKYFAEYIYTSEQREQFEHFFLESPQRRKDIGISDVDLNKALETVRTNELWAQKYRKNLYQWLKQKSTTPTRTTIKPKQLQEPINKLIKHEL